MKPIWNRVFCAVVALLLLGAVSVTFADEAFQPINRDCTLDWEGFCNYPNRLYDSNWKTGVDLKSGATGTIRWTDAQNVGLIWWEWTKPPQRCTFTFLDAEGNTLLAVERTNEGDRGYLDVPEGAYGIRLTVESPCRMTEWQVYAKDRIPENLQRWEPAPEKCDIMLVVAHSDDELVMMGGIIPTYAAERGNAVQVVYCYVPEMDRHGEALDGLWYSGMRTLPTFFQITDEHRLEFHRKITEQIRKYKPEVVITHDLNGEYGNPGHKLVSRETCHAVASASDPKAFLDSAKKYGTWEVKKFYVHLYKENPIVMDFDTPLQSHNGMTAFEVAQEAYAFHKSQRSDWLKQLRSNRWDCRKYGLYSSTVGEDVQKNDFLENIPRELLSNFVPTPASTETPTPEPTPTEQPTPTPAPSPTPMPTDTPSPTPTAKPTPMPTDIPTEIPTAEPEQPQTAVIPMQAWLLLGGAGIIAVAALTGLLIWHKRKMN